MKIEVEWDGDCYVARMIEGDEDHRQVDATGVGTFPSEAIDDLLDQAGIG